MRFRFAGFSLEIKSGTLTANRVLSLPDVGGILAVTSQLKRTSLLVTASRNLVATDAQLHLYSISASSFVLTIPPTTFAADDEIELSSDPAATGTLTIACGAGVTVNGSSTSIVIPAKRSGFLKFRTASAANFYAADPIFTTDYQEKNTKPTTRKDGSSLQTGDRWYNSALRLGFWWTGTIWQGLQENFAQCSFGILAVNNNFHSPIPIPTSSLSIAILSISASITRSGTQDAANYWTVQLSRITIAGVSTAIGSVLTFTVAGGAPAKATTFDYVQLINSTSVVISTTDSASLFQLLYSQTGSPGQLQAGSGYVKWAYVAV